MKGIILHAGHGTRLRPLTHTGPKQLLPIANKPMSQYCIESLRDAGIIDIAIVIGGVGFNKVKEYYQNGDKFGVNISYIEQDSPKGIAHAISLCKDFVSDEKFVVFLGDNIMSRPINDLVQKFSKNDIDALLLLCEVDNPKQFGVAEIDGKKIKQIIEKPKIPSSNLAVTGIYFLTSEIFNFIKLLKPSWRNELEIADALQLLLDKNKKVDFEIITDFWKDTGTPNDIILANSKVLENLFKKYSNKIHDSKHHESIFIGKSTTIDKNSKIIEPVLIGQNCIIDNNAIIGPNVTIGDNCHISGCNINNSIIMSNCQIKTKINLANSIIAYNCKILLKNESDSHDQFLLGEGTDITL